MTLNGVEAFLNTLCGLGEEISSSVFVVLHCMYRMGGWLAEAWWRPDCRLPEPPAE